MENDDVITFDPVLHRYEVNGDEYPSVSTVLSILADYSRVPREVLERKRQIGKATHKAIELYSADELDPESVDPAIQPYLESWIKFVATKPLRVIASERIVYSKKYRVAGTFDLGVEFADEPGVNWLLDLKCTYDMAPETALQTAAYLELNNENDEVKFTKRAGLQLKPDGSMAEFYPYTGRQDFLLFLNALNLHRWKRNNT